jgi:hypothetical protein
MDRQGNLTKRLVKVDQMTAPEEIWAGSVESSSIFYAECMLNFHSRVPYKQSLDANKYILKCIDYLLNHKKSALTHGRGERWGSVKSGYNNCT